MVLSSNGLRFNRLRRAVHAPPLVCSILSGRLLLQSHSRGKYDFHGQETFSRKTEVMKTVILCGGLGTRLSEETKLKPKPMVDIGGRPILWHIMKMYEAHGVSDFLLALGYKGEVVKDYFLNYHARQSDLTVHLKNGRVDYESPDAEDWRVSLIDTGLSTIRVAVCCA